MSRIDRMVAAIDPVPQAAEPGEEVAALFETIVATPVKGGRRRVRRAVVIPLAAVLGAVAVVVGLAFVPADAPVGIAPNAALAFQRVGDDWVVTVKDLYADPERFTSEFKARGFDIELFTAPGSPSVAGQLAFSETAEGTTPVKEESVGCDSPGGGCTVSFRIPADFKGRMQLGFARPARAGERYEFSGRVDAAGELLHCVPFRGMTVDEVRGALAKRGGSIEEFRVGEKSEVAREVPGGWYVESAVPWAPGQVLAWAQPDPPQFTPEEKARMKKGMAGCPGSD
ncbi:hypothetical protein C1I98_18340 [Spongiactinospora gelatinilytica]|uniref:Uncharacterized protein n=1 Tax=Spongiactinospora gelatinilytica TaxID=2666298 RepID=A0A2W2HXZ8_9ACTN|nr:hypothetical protein [Spongiactinospora gelatinilytica]PZG43444.1 hypothetical protein C1I98_18340 [Spongiactinospora gelatinilytica]